MELRVVGFGEFELDLLVSRIKYKIYAMAVKYLHLGTT